MKARTTRNLRGRLAADERKGFGIRHPIALLRVEAAAAAARSTHSKPHHGLENAYRRPTGRENAGRVLL